MWLSSGPHHSCSHRIRCRGCPGWASTPGVAWHHCSTGHELDNTCRTKNSQKMKVLTTHWKVFSLLEAEASSFLPVQIIDRVSWASFSTVATIVSIVKYGPTIRHDAQDHTPELVERLVVQGMGWSRTSKSNQKSAFMSFCSAQLQLWIGLDSPTDRLRATRNTALRLFILRLELSVEHSKLSAVLICLYIESQRPWELHSQLITWNKLTSLTMHSQSQYTSSELWCPLFSSVSTVGF